MSQAVPLTKGDLSALRSADTICFDHNKGVSKIRAILKESDTVAFEQTRAIYCESILTDHEAPRVNQEQFSAFVYCGSAKFDEELRTILSLLKIGDKLMLVWQRGALTHEAMKAVGFVGDKLVLRVIRGDKMLSFCIDQQCGHDNTARMIKGPRAADYAII